MDVAFARRKYKHMQLVTDQTLCRKAPLPIDLARVFFNQRR